MVHILQYYCRRLLWRVFYIHLCAPPHLVCLVDWLVGIPKNGNVSGIFDWATKTNSHECFNVTCVRVSGCGWRISTTTKKEKKKWEIQRSLRNEQTNKQIELKFHMKIVSGTKNFFHLHIHLVLRCWWWWWWWWSFKLVEWVVL